MGNKRQTAIRIIGFGLYADEMIKMIDAVTGFLSTKETAN
jgi:hypothetical protein